LRKIASQFNEMGLSVIVDSMHGSAAGCMKEIFNSFPTKFLEEIRADRDVLLGGDESE
tara:strand:+ start:165 stop:338 length:174 start_codon:yes stop_codon:yes gene_type:complete